MNQESTLQKISKIEDAIERVKVLRETITSNILPALTDHENYPTVFRLSREIGTGTVKMFLAALIEETVRSLNISNAPNKEQVLEIASELIKDHPTLKLEDFKLFFLNYRKGRYGKDFSRFDILTVYSALEGDNSYLSERAELLENALRTRKVELEKPEPYSDTFDIDKLISEHLKPKKKEISGIALRDRYRTLASKQYAKEYFDWLGEREDTDETIIEYAKISIFNQDYIEKFINENIKH